MHLLDRRRSLAGQRQKLLNKDQVTFTSLPENGQLTFTSDTCGPFDYKTVECLINADSNIINSARVRSLIRRLHKAVAVLVEVDFGQLSDLKVWESECLAAQEDRKGGGQRFDGGHD